MWRSGLFFIEPSKGSGQHKENYPFPVRDDSGIIKSVGLELRIFLIFFPFTSGHLIVNLHLSFFCNNESFRYLFGSWRQGDGGENLICTLYHCLEVQEHHQFHIGYCEIEEESSPDKFDSHSYSRMERKCKNKPEQRW